MWGIRKRERESPDRKLRIQHFSSKIWISPKLFFWVKSRYTNVAEDIRSDNIATYWADVFGTDFFIIIK
jgi:hypothetical protein